DEEALQVINLERIVLIYDLMMKNEVERRGSWSHDGGPESTEESLKKLAAIISRFSDATPEMLYSTLGQALAEGNLTCTDRNGSVRWQWVDRLE
ncbi:MAG: hypothetical protein JRC59_09695, partial [Deltaproteobacteria bacterium]|nr:hypothetical protein [Deltaproteobacteria bacterium]